MKKNICILLILISYVSCSNGQNKEKSDDKIDYTKEIIGCWRAINMNYEIKSNYPKIDSFIVRDRQNSVERKINKTHVIKFTNDIKYEFINNEYDPNPSSYYVKEDSLFMEGIFRKDPNTAKLKIIKDTLYLKLDSSREFRRYIHNLKWDYEIDVPKDIKLEKMIRNVTFVRVPDCDQYKE